MPLASGMIDAPRTPARWPSTKLLAGDIAPLTPVVATSPRHDEPELLDQKEIKNIISIRQRNHLDVVPGSPPVSELITAARLPLSR